MPRPPREKSPYRRARSDDLGEKFRTRTGSGDPVRPAAPDRVIAGLQRVISIGHAKPAGKAAGDPVRLVDHPDDTRYFLEPDHLGESGGRTVGRAGRGRIAGHPIADRPIFDGVVVHERRPERPPRRIDGQQRAGRAIDSNGGNAPGVAAS
jgi:hypothetical protein